MDIYIKNTKINIEDFREKEPQCIGEVIETWRAEQRLMEEFDVKSQIKIVKLDA